MSQKNQNFWANLLGKYEDGKTTPTPEPDPTPDPSPQATGSAGFLQKLGAMLPSLHHDAPAGPPAPEAPSAASSWMHSLGDILSLHHHDSAPAGEPTPAPNAAPPAYRTMPGRNARAGRAVLPPPQPPSDANPGPGASSANQAAIRAQDTPAMGVPPIDASSLPNPGAMAAQIGNALPPVAPRSGQKREGDLSAETHQDQKSTRSSWAGGDQMKQITDSIMSLPMIQEQQKQNELHKSLLALNLAANPHRLDLSPLAEIADSWVQNQKPGMKSNLAESAMDQYKQRQLKQNTLEQGLRDVDTSQKDLSNTVLKAAQDFKNGQDTKDAYTKLAESAKSTNADPMAHINPLQALTTMSHLVERGMNTQKDQEAAVDIRNLQGMLADGSAVTDRNFPLTLAKVVGGSGRIAAYEVAREAGSPELARQFDQLWGTLANGRITPENMRDYANFVNLLAKNHLQYRQIQANRFAGLAPRYGLQPEDSQALLPGSFVHDVPTGVAPGSRHGQSNVNGSGGVKPSIDNLIQKYLQQRNQGGK